MLNVVALFRSCCSVCWVDFSFVDWIAFSFVDSCVWIFVCLFVYRLRFLFCDCSSSVRTCVLDFIVVILCVVFYFVLVCVLILLYFDVL